MLNAKWEISASVDTFSISERGHFSSRPHGGGLIAENISQRGHSLMRQTVLKRVDQLIVQSDLEGMGLSADGCLDVFIDQVFRNMERFTEYHKTLIAAYKAHKVYITIFNGQGAVRQLEGGGQVRDGPWVAMEDL